MLPKSDLICLHYIAGPAKASHIAAVWKPLASRGHLIATKTFAFESVFAWHNFQNRPLLLWPNKVRLDTRVKLGLIRQFIIETVLAKKNPRSVVCSWDKPYTTHFGEKLLLKGNRCPNIVIAYKNHSCVHVYQYGEASDAKAYYTHPLNQPILPAHQIL